MSSTISIPEKLSRTISEPYEGPEVPAIKQMLNLVIVAGLDVESKKFGPKTRAAVRLFQQSQNIGHDGCVGPITYSELLRMYGYHYMLSYDLAIPKWIQVAYGELKLGVKRVSGENSNPRIVEYLMTCPSLANTYSKNKMVPQLDKKTGKPILLKNGEPIMREVYDTDSPKVAEIDETAWCAAFVNWCLKKSGYPGLDNTVAGLAKSWLNYGTSSTSPRYGAITVVYTSKIVSETCSGYHVGFRIDGGIGNSVVLLGGNQGKSSEISIAKFVGWQIKGFMWPMLD